MHVYKKISEWHLSYGLTNLCASNLDPKSSSVHAVGLLCTLVNLLQFATAVSLDHTSQLFELRSNYPITS